MRTEDVVYILSRTTMFGGMAALGAAGAFSISLQQLQVVCIQAGILPGPGTPMGLAQGMLEGNACWSAALWLQNVAEITGYGGAGLLLIGGVLDRFGDRVVEAVAA